MASDAHGQPGAAGSRHRLAYSAHLAPGQPELGSVQDRFVAEFQRVQAGLAKCFGPSRTGAHVARRPAVALAQRQPCVDGLRPRPRVADRIATGQADTDLDAVGDRGAAARRENHRLVATGGEVPQRVVLAPQLEQPTNRRFVLAGQCVVGPLRLEQHDRGDDQRHRTEQPEERVEEYGRAAGELRRLDDGESDHPVHHIEQPVFGGQRAGKRLDETPGHHDSDRPPGQQHARPPCTAHPGGPSPRIRGSRRSAPPPRPGADRVRASRRSAWPHWGDPLSDRPRSNPRPATG